MNISLHAAHVVALHDDALSRADWPPTTGASVPNATNNVMDWIAANHRFNALLWDEEDLARRTKASDSEIAANKRAIDRYNQARNDATERVDECLLIALDLVDPETARSDAPQPRVREGAVQHSETAGAMIDRLSIMALKIRAMRAQTQRIDVDPAHIALSQRKLAQLLAQRADLAACLDDLLKNCAAGFVYFKTYRQFKMYNDAKFNPALVAERNKAE
jgi:hypothetical protein